jgi:hypothetical protein
MLLKKAPTTTLVPVKPEDMKNCNWAIFRDSMNRVQVRLMKEADVLPIICFAKPNVNTTLQIHSSLPETETLPERGYQPEATGGWAYYVPRNPQVASCTRGLTVAVNPLETAGETSQVLAYGEVIAYGKPYEKGERYDMKIILLSPLPQGLGLGLIFLNTGIQSLRGVDGDSDKVFTFPSSKVKFAQRETPTQRIHVSPSWVAWISGMLGYPQGYVVDPNTGLVIAVDPKKELTESSL